jgi:gas vesicle protein
LQTKIAKVVEEFSLDRPDSALSRLVKNVEGAQQKITAEFSLDKGDSALSRLRKELTETLETLRRAQQAFQEEVKRELEKLQVRREEMQRSVQHGLQFEQALCQRLRQDPYLHGHLVEFVGDRPGKLSRVKTGDIIVQLNNDSAAAGAKIVVEAKDQQGYTLSQALEEIKQARENREAQVGVFVFSRKTLPGSMPPLTRYDNDVVTFWDMEDPSTDIYLQAALLVAQALCVRAARQQSTADMDIRTLERIINELENSLQSLSKIEDCAKAIQNRGKDILKESERLRDTLTDQLEALKDCTGSLRRLYEAAR